MQRSWLVFILFFFLNLISGLSTDLSHDEAYYWIYSQFLSFGYFDHPPMVGWWIKIGTSLLGKTEVGVRFLFMMAQAASLTLIWRLIDKKYFPLFFTLALSFPLLMGAGILALPDTPLLFFATCFIYILKDYLERDNLKNTSLLTLATIGLIYSKYHGFVLLFFTVVGAPKLLMRRSFWTIFIIALIAFIPYMHWLYAHDFITFNYHMHKRKQRPFDITNILDYLGAQIMMTGLFAAFPIYYLVAKHKVTTSFYKVAKFNLYGLLGLLLFSSLRNRIEANWTTVNFIIIFPLLWNALKNCSAKMRRLIIWASLPSMALLIIFRVIIIFPSLWPWELGKLQEFNDSKAKVAKILQVAQGEKIIANTYQVASKISFYSDQLVPALHINRRKSHFIYLDLLQNISPDEKITFVSYINLPGSLKMKYDFTGDLYILRSTSINQIRKMLEK